MALQASVAQSPASAEKHSRCYIPSISHSVKSLLFLGISSGVKSIKSTKEILTVLVKFIGEGGGGLQYLKSIREILTLFVKLIRGDVHEAHKENITYPC